MVGFSILCREVQQTLGMLLESEGVWKTPFSLAKTVLLELKKLEAKAF